MTTDLSTPVVGNPTKKKEKNKLIILLMFLTSSSTVEYLLIEF